MDEDAFDAEVRSSLLSYFQHLAEQLGQLAELQFVEEDFDLHKFEQDYEGTVGHWSLRPANPEAAEVQWHVTESDAYSTYLALGRYTWVEVLTHPKKQSPTEAAAGTIEAVEAVIAGRFLEEAWFSKSTGQLSNSLGRIRYDPEGRWSSIGEISRPLPLLRRLLYLQITYSYAPYRGTP
ncbi:hypothetical protein [Nitriliruptor alkaliphilus]|uniref:hypothetical protein n=1 Tax=Nitriliruptor alkaliphilus TaxID=427918 RepID=UPI0006979655|nr:hypothetical protein [Nitriliruptor alkaliphilus]